MTKGEREAVGLLLATIENVAPCGDCGCGEDVAPDLASPGAWPRVLAAVQLVRALPDALEAVPNEHLPGCKFSHLVRRGLAVSESDCSCFYVKRRAALADVEE